MKQDFNTKLDSLLREERIAFRSSQESAKRSVMERIGHPVPVIPIRRNSKNLYRLAIAASVAVLAALSIVFVGNKSIENNTEEIVAHTLPDGSEVFMRPNSTISYNLLLWDFHRSVNFKGTGFFEVEKGEKFDVETDIGMVTVLGTSFSVITFEEVLKVSCKTGRVLVKNQDGLSTILGPGMAVKMKEDEALSIMSSSQYIDQWISGSYRFDNVHISEVFNSIEDILHIEIQIQKDLEFFYSGELRTDQTLEEILEIVCKPLLLEYEINRDKNLIRITKK
ncbi:MAG: FecR domain-containing protein [Flavobacteriales bacterium]|nr:FecR domain-containing protein [Flavobacteriales bacterium]